MNVSRVAGTSITVVSEALREPPFAVDVIVNETCIVSRLHVWCAVVATFGHAPPAASEANDAVPLVMRHSVAAPPVPTSRNSPLPMFDAPPMTPCTDVGAVAAVFCAEPPTSTMRVMCEGSSKPRSVHVDQELPARLTTRWMPTK